MISPSRRIDGVLRFDPPSPRTRHFSSLVRAQLDAMEHPPQHADARIEDVLTGEVLAVANLERGAFVCTTEGRRRVSREVFRGAA